MTTTRNRRKRTLPRQRSVARWLTLLGVVVGILLIGSFLFDDMGMSQYLSMREHARELEQRIQSLRESNQALGKEIDRMQHDPVRMEELARGRLGFVRKGETVYQFVQGTEERFFEQ